MGKKKIAAMVVAVVAAVASYNIYQSQKTNTLSDLALANVEALASQMGQTCYDKWRKAPDDGSLAYWAWICSECEAYWLVEAGNRSLCVK